MFGRQIHCVILLGLLLGSGGYGYEVRVYHSETRNLQPLRGLVAIWVEPDEWGRAGGAVLAESSTCDAGRLEVPPGLPECFLRLTGHEGTATYHWPSGGIRETLWYPVFTEAIILHDNDHHFHDNHESTLLTVVEEMRSRHENVFLLHAGDIFVRHRSRWNPAGDESYYLHWSVRMVRSMNRLGYNAMTLGNHELYYIGDFTRQALRLASFPLLGANVEVTHGLLDPPDPYTILTTRNGLGLAFLGVTVGGADGVTVHPAGPTLESYGYLADENALFGILSHLGYRSDRALAETFPDVHLIIGGHSHTLLLKPEKHQGVTIAQAGGFPHLEGGRKFPDDPRPLGILRVTFRNNQVFHIDGEVAFLDSVGVRPKAPMELLGVPGPGRLP